jgi:hypothetical protein
MGAERQLERPLENLLGNGRGRCAVSMEIYDCEYLRCHGGRGYVEKGREDGGSDGEIS